MKACINCERHNCRRCSGECNCRRCNGLGNRGYETRTIDVTFDVARPEQWISDLESGLLDGLTETQLEALRHRATKLLRALRREGQDAARC